MKFLILILTIYLLGSCQQNSNTLDQILESKTTNDDLFNKLEGEWKGYFNTYMINSDTVLYSKGEKIENGLFDTPKLDSLGIKEINQTIDTIKNKISISFLSSSNNGWINNTTIKTDSINNNYHLNTNISLLGTSDKRIITLTSDSINTRTVIISNTKTIIFNSESTISQSPTPINIPQHFLFPGRMEFEIIFVDNQHLKLKSTSLSLFISLIKE